MKLKNIFLKTIAIIAIILITVLCTNIFNVVQANNTVIQPRSTGLPTRTVTDNQIEDTNVQTEYGIMPINETYDEDDEQLNMILEIGSVKIDKYEGNREVIVPVKLTDADAVCGGTLVINYFGLEFVGEDNKDSKYQYTISNNSFESKLVITFIGASGYDGNIDLLNLKFNLPKEIEDNGFYRLDLSDDTKLLTVNTETNDYTLKDGEISIVKGNVSNFSIVKVVLIIVLTVIVLIILLIVVRKIKTKK